ncbi:hypothetical protein JTE90_024765 [Oedothorax gibbosus]|uniref:Uncharacterized protein n=1 Tax=Oedothorax gibbosus TaxID=931172 RepID=A0AAV6U902_9ARAC|nr:hypothetical protein JTE90_024765 [Oedothorax gibbosus]
MNFPSTFCLNFKETNKLKTANSENPQVLCEFEDLSSKKSKVVKEVSEAGALLVPEVHASTSEASTNDYLADSSLSSAKLPNQDSSSKESSYKANEAPPTIIQSNLNNTKSIVDSNVPIYSTGICKQIPSPASLVEEILEIVPVEQSVATTLPVYSTGICKQFPSPASLVEEIPEIVPVEQSTENSSQLPLNEQREKASGNSALLITLPVYSTNICKQFPSPASLVEETPEIVPVEQSSENVLQDKCEETSDNSLYETLDEQF